MSIDINDFVVWLRENNYKFNGNQATRSAEQLPLAGLNEFAKLRDQRELFPFAMTGPELDTYVKKQVADYKVLAKEFGLIQ